MQFERVERVPYMVVKDSVTGKTHKSLRIKMSEPSQEVYGLNLEPHPGEEYEVEPGCLVHFESHLGFTGTINQIGVDVNVVDAEGNREYLRKKNIKINLDTPVTVMSTEKLEIDVLFDEDDIRVSSEQPMPVWGLVIHTLRRYISPWGKAINIDYGRRQSA